MANSLEIKDRYSGEWIIKNEVIDGLSRSNWMYCVTGL